MMRRWGAALALALATGGCSCDEPTDEERLREMVDTTKVHLYVATKIAVTKTGSDPEVQAARAHLLEATAALQRLADDRAPREEGESAEEALSRAMATGGDVVSLARAVWELRAQGAEVVRTRKEDDLEPVLPVILTGTAPDLLAHYDMNTEHAVLLLAMFTLKLHPKSPTPIPTEVMLYEAWMTDPGTLKLPGLEPPVRAVRAYVYAESDLCDLAGEEGDALAAADAAVQQQRMRETLQTIGADVTEEQVRSMHAVSRALAHGSAALCYLRREEDEKAQRELRRFVDAAEESGAAPEDTAIIRAYLAYEDGDIDGTRRYLELAKQSEYADEQDKREIDELLRYLRETDDRDALTDFYDRAFFASFTAQLFFHELERSGVADGVRDTDLYRAAYAWAVASGRTIGAARDAIPSFSDAADQGKSWVEELLGGG